MPVDCSDYDAWSRMADELLRRLGEAPSVYGEGAFWSPPTDVFETSEGVVVKMELPGVRPDDVSIVLVDDRLVIKGRRTDPDAGQKTHYHQMEIAYGMFAKVVFLRMPCERDGITARMSGGYLRLVIPRTAERSGEKIAVEIRL